METPVPDEYDRTTLNLHVGIRQYEKADVPKRQQAGNQIFFPAYMKYLSDIKICQTI